MAKRLERVATSIPDGISHKVFVGAWWINPPDVALDGGSGPVLGVRVEGFVFPMVAESPWWLLAFESSSVCMQPVAKPTGISTRVRPIPALHVTQTPIHFPGVAPTSSRVLPEVDKEEDQPKRFLDVTGALVEDCCFERVEKLILRVGSAGTDVSGRQHPDKLDAMNAFHDLLEQHSACSWVRNPWKRHPVAVKVL